MGALRGLGGMHGGRHVHRQHPERLQPAVALARAGCTPSAQLAFIIGLLEPIVELTPATHALFVRDGQIFLANPRLADFLEAFAEGRARPPCRAARSIAGGGLPF